MNGQTGERVVDRPPHVVQTCGERGEFRPHAGIFRLQRSEFCLALLVEQVETVDQVRAAVHSQTAAGVDERFLVGVCNIPVRNVTDRVVTKRARGVANRAAGAGGGVMEILAVLLFFPCFCGAGAVVNGLGGIMTGNVRTAVGHLTGGRAQTFGSCTHVAHGCIHG